MAIVFCYQKERRESIDIAANAELNKAAAPELCTVSMTLRVPELPS